MAARKKPAAAKSATKASKTDDVEIGGGKPPENSVYIGQSIKPEYIWLRLANRHGLITGATGTGKTVTLQGLAEGFSDQGVPVFCADVKGDLSGVAEAGEMKRFATRLGVTDMAIITEEQSRNTYENAVNVRRLVNHESILLVTSAYHLPRAVAIFAKQGFQVTPAPCGYETKDRPGEGLDQINVTDFLPSYHALETTTHAVDELAGIVVYWMTGAL